jgi:hypothetical protein
MDIAHEESVFVSAGLSSRGEEVASVSALTGRGLRELVDLTVRRLFEIKGGGSI